MSEVDRIREQLRRAFVADAWHGPAVLEAIAGIDVRLAAHAPASGAHSIGEIVLHMAVWKRVVADRIRGRQNEPTPAEDWRPLRPATAARWRRAIAELRAAHRTLESAVKRLKDDDLEVRPLGYSTRYVLIHGAIQHDLYHAGQIVVLAKAARAEAPVTRRRAVRRS
jgi:uncharacterized damage-inducible protein DinB